MKGPATEADPDHDHGPGVLVLPLGAGRARCPSRGSLELRVTLAREADVEVELLGRRIRERAPAGESTLTASVALASAPPGRHAVKARIAGREIAVPAVEIVP